MKKANNSKTAGWGRNDNPIAPVTIAATAVTLCAMAATALWVCRLENRSAARARLRQIDAIGTVLAFSAETMLADEELSPLRSLVCLAARDYGLAWCRVVLPDNQVVADSRLAEINTQRLPAQWTSASMDLPRPPGRGEIVRCYTLHVPARGPARLEITAPTLPVADSLWEAEAGVGAISVVSLLFLLGTTRRLRARSRLFGALRQCLLAAGHGERSRAVLGIQEELGPEASVWNALLAELEQRQQARMLEQAGRSADGDGASLADKACRALADGLIVLDGQSFVRYANPAAAALLRLVGPSPVGRRISELLDSIPLADAVRYVTSRPPGPAMVVEHQDANRGCLRITVRRLAEAAQPTICLFIEDITQQRASEKARCEFISQVAHELRTPLTNIRLSVEVAAEDGADPVEAARSMDVISRESSRLAQMIDEMLSAAQIETGTLCLTRDAVRVDELLREMEADFAAQAADKGLRFDLELPVKCPQIQADKAKLTLAVHNLVGNALKYTPSGGQVKVVLEVNTGDLQMAVTDSGIGIASEEQARVFDRFYRSADPRVGRLTGTGLGLTLVRDVIRLHGGDIEVRSELDRGSTFLVRLPLPKEAA